MSIEIIDLSHTYSKGLTSEVKALIDVSLSIESGSFVSIIGKTGSGKTTLLEHFNGLLKPDSGNVVIDGVDINKEKKRINEIRKKIGFVFQLPDYQLFSDTVLNDIKFGPANLRLDEKEIEKVVDEAVELVRLDKELLDKSPFELSGGEKRKVALAGVLAMKPNILILDEPTAYLDPFSKENFFKVLLDIRTKTKITIVLVSHDLNETSEYAEKVAVLNEGKLVFFDTPSKLFYDEAFLNELKIGTPDVVAFVNKLGSNSLRGVVKYSELLEKLK